MLVETWRVPSATWVTLAAISRVAADCSSTAPAMAEAMSATLRMVSVMLPMAPTEVWVADCMAETWDEISCVARAVWSDRLFTSEATTAKPLPASPARAASMVAFRASSLVWPAMSLIRVTTLPIFCAASARVRMASLVRSASVTACWEMLLDSAT
ncbi:hypothetical protein D3C72_1672880 [compost metagenome]